MHPSPVPGRFRRAADLNSSGVRLVLAAIKLSARAEGALCTVGDIPRAFRLQRAALRCDALADQAFRSARHAAAYRRAA